MKLNVNQAGLTVGTISAASHLLWIIAVAIGIAQPLSDWWHSAHFLDDMHEVATIGGGTAIIGLISAFVVGYVVGWVFAWVWNFYSTVGKDNS